MQNRIDELFLAARTEQPFYSYQEAEKLVKSFPAGGFAIPKIPTMILGTVLIGAATLLLTADLNTKPETPLKQEFLMPATDSTANTISSLPLPETLKILKPLQPAPVTYNPMGETNDLFFGGASQPAPKYELVEKKKTDPEYLRLTAPELEKLGIYYKENESLKYEIRNGRKRPLISIHIEFNGSRYANVSASDTLRDYDIRSSKPYCALFTEIQINEEVPPNTNGTGTYIPAGLIRFDPSIDFRYERIALEHLKPALIPVLVDVKTQYGTVKFIFYFIPTSAMQMSLPPDTDPKWLDIPDFDWEEYERYRKMLWVREHERREEISRNGEKALQKLSAAPSVTDPKQLKKLGLIYNGKSVKANFIVTAAGEFAMHGRVHFSAGATRYNQDDPYKPSLSYPMPVFFSDSAFLNVLILQLPNVQLLDERDSMPYHAINMADSLIPVLVPLYPTLREKFHAKRHPGLKLKTHIIFWYRKEDLEKAGFGK